MTHTVSLEFMVQNGVCESGTGTEFLPAQWTGWWRDPVLQSTFNLTFDPLLELTNNLHNVRATFNGAYDEHNFSVSGSSIECIVDGNPEFLGFLWPADMFPNNTIR